MQNDYIKHRKKLLIITIALSAAAVCLFFISMCVGRYYISVSDVIHYFVGIHIPDVSANVIRHLRIPRTILALLIGCSLSVSGTIYQSAFNNKLVSPDLLGVASGAGTGACLAILLGLSGELISVFSFLTGFGAVILTVSIAAMFRNRNNVILLLAGIAVGGLMSSFIGLIKYLADDELKLAEMTYWLLGDISGTTMEHVRIILPITIIGTAIACLLSWKLNIIALGKKEAISLGINYRLNMGILIFTATLLTAGAVSVSGTVGWIGLVMPNIIRLAAGSDNRNVMLPSALSGACFMVITDMLARSLAPDEIPLSIITGLIGTPLFIIAIFNRRKELQ